MALQIVQPSGGIIHVSLCDNMRVREVRSHVVAVLSTIGLGTITELISSSGVLVRDDDLPAETLGELATLVIQLVPFDCSFGSGGTSHPIPQIMRRLDLLHFNGTYFPRHRILERLRVRAVPQTHVSWEDFVNAAPEFFTYRAWAPQQVTDANGGSSLRLADLIWDICFRHHHRDDCIPRPDDSAGAGTARWYCHSVQAGWFAEDIAEMTELVQVMGRYGTFAQAIFPDALEPIAARIIIGTADVGERQETIYEFLALRPSLPAHFLALAG